MTKNRQPQRAIIIKLLELLHEKGNWCGETHIQKTVFFIKELTGIPIDFSYILYKHSPYSFDLHDELTVMRVEALIDLKVKYYPYGPGIYVTETGRNLLKQFAEKIQKFNTEINFIVDIFAEKYIGELERLAIALYVTHTKSRKDGYKRATYIHEVKPHISVDQANDAVIEIDKILSNINWQKIHEQKIQQI
jgi:predicted ATPase